MTRKFLPLLALSTLAFAGTAQAIPIQFSIDGVVTQTFAGNIFGLDVGDTVTATAFFDDSLFTDVGEVEINFGAGSGNTMSHSIGAITFIESMDQDFAGGEFPQLEFEDGIFAGWDILVGAGVNGAAADYSAGDDFRAALGDSPVLGVWNPDTARFTTTVAVPEPTTLLLFALGLLIVGLRSRA